MNWFQRMLLRPFFIRLLHWEYWSFNVVYGPIYLIWVGLSMRARSFFFFAAANPGIRNGGFLNESKKDISALIPPAFLPKTLFVGIPADEDRVVAQLEKEGIGFPMIGKPDIGGRGRGVRALHNEEDLGDYIRGAPLDFHIQEFVPYALEAGIFYYRYPDEEQGHISGIVGKSFLCVTGNGQSTVRELLAGNKRAILQQKSLKKIPGLLDTVFPAGEERVLVPIGNHARGTLFLDESGLADEKLTLAIDKICRQIPGFYFGRLDIRFSSWDELKRGERFAIIEVNGAGSEPTHIYDPVHSIFFAWKEIVRHWLILWKISRQNHRRGHPYLCVKKGLDMFREDKYWSEKLELMSK